MSVGTAIIYFDDEDTDIDGYGWNVVDYGGTVAARFGSLTDAINITMSWGFDFVVVSKNLTVQQGLRDLNQFATL